MVRKINILFAIRFLFVDFRKYAFFIFFLQFVGLDNFSFGQNAQNPFVFKKFIDGEGTLTNIVDCFLEDKGGYMWVGTADGLKRFDGHEFTVFKHDKNNPNSLAHNEIEALCEDNSGRIWVGTGQGIGYYDKAKNKFFNFKKFNKSNNICFNILCDDRGDIWFSIRKQGLFRYSVKSKKLQNFALNPKDKYSLSSNRIFQKGMIFDPLKRGIWLQTEKGINFFEFSSQHFYNKNNNPKNLAVYDSENCRGLNFDKNDLVFFDKDAQKIKYFDVAREKISQEIILKIPSKKEKIEILYIFIDAQHNLWLSDWFSYCYYLEIKTNQLFTLSNNASNPNSIASNSFWCTYQQKDGTIWLGTNNGISYTNPQKSIYKVYDIAELYPPLKVKNQLYCFIEDHEDSTWWLAANERSFIHYFPQKNSLKVYNIPKSYKISDQFIRAFAQHQDGIFVISTGSFHRFDKVTKKMQELRLPDSLNHKNIISHATQKGDSIWFFCDNAQAYSYKIPSKKWSKYPILTRLQPDQSSSYPFLSNTHQTTKRDALISTQSSISCSEVDSNGNLWIAIQNTGLAKFSKQKQAFELISAKNDIDFQNTTYTGMRKDNEGNFWIGTYGLLKFNPNKKEFSSLLDVNVINDLLIDDEGKIWTTAYNDFTILFPKTNKIMKQTIPMNKGNLLWINSLYFLKNRQIVSLMRGIITVLDPQKLIPNATKDKVLISKIQILGTEILLHQDSSTVNFQASENVFMVYFSTLNLESKSKYMFQLAGFQKKWISTTNFFTSYSNLDGGNYVFKVKGVDENGNETPVSTLNIHIDTIFYKSKWFLYFCLLAIFSIIYAFIRFRSNERAKIYKLQVQSTQLEKDKTEIQYQNLINHLNPHFLFNSLTSLNSLIMTEPKEASKFLQKLSLIYRYILQNKDKEVIRLEQELAFVKHYIELQKSRFEDGLQIKIEVEKEHLTSGIVPVTLQNLFENAIKHNSVEEDKPLVISVFIEDEYLIVKNNLQLKKYVQTSNKQGLESLKSLYKFLSKKPFKTYETENEFIVKIPLL